MTQYSPSWMDQKRANRIRGEQWNDTMFEMSADVYEDDINFYTVSEIVRGGELCDYLKEKRFSERQAVNVIRQVLLALNYMH